MHLPNAPTPFRREWGIVPEGVSGQRDDVKPSTETQVSLKIGVLFQINIVGIGSLFNFEDQPALNTI